MTPLFAKSKRVLLLFWIVLFTAVIFRALFLEQISTKALYDFDEARYAEVAKNVLKSGQVLVPLAGGPDDPQDINFYTLPNGASLHPYFWKPPLHTLTIAFFYTIFGVNELSTRLPSLLFSLASLLTVFIIARLISGNRFVPYLAVLIWVSSNDFSFISSQGLSDAEFLFFALMSVYFALNMTVKRSIASGFFLGLALLTKSFAGFWIPFVVLFLIIQSKKQNRLSHIIFLFITALITMLPWHLYMYSIFGGYFVYGYVVANTLKRSVEASANLAPIQWYFIYMLDQWKTYIFMLPALGNAFVSLLRKERSHIFLLLFWLFIIIVPFSIAQSKVWWYIYPAWPPFAILLAALLMHDYPHKNKINLLLISTAIISLLPYWQLSTTHIPLRQFLIFSAGVFAITVILKKIKISKILNIHTAVVLLIFFFAVNFQSVKQINGRGDFNKSLKDLGKRNKNITNFAVYQMPYEAALYYFDSGVVGRKITNNTRFILVNKDSTAGLDLKMWKIADKEDNLILYKKK